MPTGKGVWVHPDTGEVFVVTRHERWLKDPVNQQQVGLSGQYVHVLNQLDVEKDIDLIRMVGVRAGLIRIRDYYNRVSVQFHAVQSGVAFVLQRVADAILIVSDDKFAFLELHNMLDDSSVCLHLPDLQTALKNEEPLQWKHPQEGKRPSLKLLDEAVDRLLIEASKHKPDVL